MPFSLLLKLVVTPLLIAGATLVGRRWGDTLSGWLVGLPFTSGPVIFFLALDQGTHFAATASLGVVLGVTSQAVFALAYVYFGGRRRWLLGALAASISFAAVTALFNASQLPLRYAQLVPLVAFASLVISIALMPRPAQASGEVGAPGFIDLPLRIVVATALVVGLTAIAPALGARLSGLVSPFPLYAGILAVFAQQRSGFSAAIAVWRGLLFGLFAFLGLFTMLAALLVPLGITAAFALAVAVALVVQGGTLVFLRLGWRARAPV